MKTPKKELKALLDLAKECLEKPNSEVCQAYKDKILDACPSLKVKSEVLEVRQWYELTDNLGHYVICLTNIVYNKLFDGSISHHHYGFKDGVWHFTSWASTESSKQLKKADPKKVEELLIAEAKKRGFKKGVIVKELIGFNVGSLNSKNKKEAESDNLYLDVKGGLFCGNLCVFSKGQWVEFQETISLSEAEKIIGKKIKID